MPVSPPRMCSWSGCAEVVHGRAHYCPAHEVVNTREQSRATETARPDATVRGYNARWRKYRIVFLARHPLCGNPFGTHGAGEVVPSTVVDHIVPHRGDTTLFWDKANHQAVCTRCHNYKTATQDSTFASSTKPQLTGPSGVADGGYGT